MRKAGDVTYADAHKDRRNEGWVFGSSFVESVSDEIFAELWSLLPSGIWRELLTSLMIMI